MTNEVGKQDKIRTLHEDRKEFEHLQQIEDLEPKTDEQLN